MVILDATAGCRVMWSNKKPPYTVFMDKEADLLIPPDVVGDNRQAPFRDGVFSCVLYDPPYSTKLPPWMLNKKTRPGSGGIAYYGVFSSKREMFSSLFKAAQEFLRLTNRLCFKWNEMQVPLDKILPFFKPWVLIQKLDWKTRMKRGKNKTWWVTFIKNHSWE